MRYHDGGHGHEWGRHGAVPLQAAMVLTAMRMLPLLAVLALALTEARMLPLLAVFAMIALLRLRQVRRRLRAAPARLAIEAPGPSALEVLREQYALGEIDLYTFADTAKLVLAAEVEGYSTSTRYA
jgi:uncharacterized membrane protein